MDGSRLDLTLPSFEESLQPSSDEHKHEDPLFKLNESVAKGGPLLNEFVGRKKCKSS